LRERVIGIEVFGRAPDYDTADDPVVRLRAADIRKRLAQYYQAGKNEPGSWKIEIPTGSYKAQFHKTEGSSPTVAPVAEPVSPRVEAVPANSGVILLPPKARPHKRKAIWTAILAGVSLLAGTSVWFFSRALSHPKSAFDLFWEPVLENPRPVLVCTGSNRVYVLTLEARDRYRKSHPAPQGGTPNLEAL